jgi:hypothetical protein
MEGSPAPFHFQCIAHWGACGKTPARPHNRGRSQKPRRGSCEMRLLYPIHDLRGGVASPAAVGPAAWWRRLGSEVRVSAPSDCAPRPFDRSC